MSDPRGSNLLFEATCLLSAPLAVLYLLWVLVTR